MIGPIIASLLGGKNASLVGKLLAGILGGVGAGAAASATGVGDDLLTSMVGGNLGMILQNVVEGGVGGGVLATLAGWVMRKS